MDFALPLSPSRRLPAVRAAVLVRCALAVALSTALSLAFLAQSATDGLAAARARESAGRAHAALTLALAAGVAAAGLRQETAALAALDGAAAPAQVLFLDQARRDFLRRQQEGYATIAADLGAAPAAQAAAMRQTIADTLGATGYVLRRWRDAGGDPADLQKQLDAADAATPPAAPPGLPALTQRLDAATALLQAADAGLRQQQADVQLQGQYAQEELAAASADAERQRATDLAYAAAGDAEAATHYNVAGAAAIGASVAAHAAAVAGAADPTALASTVAWLRIDALHLQDAMAGHMPDRAIYVSLGRQELRAYEGGRLVRQTLVTTGRPELPTITGSFSVLRKNSPWIMHSPFPYGSPYWYPDTRVSYVLWFDDGGYGLHDAYWRHRYGPGTNGPGTAGGTHGCVNIPYADTVWLYDWAPVGTPVTVG
jgi:hypothetical protein